MTVKSLARMLSPDLPLIICDGKKQKVIKAKDAGSEKLGFRLVRDFRLDHNAPRCIVYLQAYEFYNAEDLEDWCMGKEHNCAQCVLKLHFPDCGCGFHVGMGTEEQKALARKLINGGGATDER